MRRVLVADHNQDRAEAVVPPDMGIRTARRHVCDVPPTARNRLAAALVPLRGSEAVTGRPTWPNCFAKRPPAEPGSEWRAARHPSPCAGHEQFLRAEHVNDRSASRSVTGDRTQERENIRRSVTAAHRLIATFRDQPWLTVCIRYPPNCASVDARSTLSQPTQIGRSGRSASCLPTSTQAAGVRMSSSSACLSGSFRERVRGGCCWLRLGPTIPVSIPRFGQAVRCGGMEAVAVHEDDAAGFAGQLGDTEAVRRR